MDREALDCERETLRHTRGAVSYASPRRGNVTEMDRESLDCERETLRQTRGAVC
jgi:hypothetical protein